MKRKPLTPEEKARTWQEIKDVFFVPCNGRSLLKGSRPLNKILTAIGC
jgi:hypothetical protein